MSKDKKQLTIHEKWKLDSEAGGVGFTPNPDPDEEPLEIEYKTDKNEEK